MDSRSTLAATGASSGTARPPALPLWGRTSGSGSKSGGEDSSPPGRHSPLLDERPPPPSPPSHEPLRPVRRAWGGGAVPLVAGSPLPDVGGFSYSAFPATLAASLTSAGPAPSQVVAHDTTAAAGPARDGGAAPAAAVATLAGADDEAEAVGWISVEKQAHAHGTIAPLPLSPRPLESQPEDEAEAEADYSPRRSLPTTTDDQGDETAAAAASAGDGMAQTSITGAYDIAISAPFDFPRDDTQGTPTKQTRAEQEHATALWSKVALLPAGLLSHSVELLGNRSDTLYFGQGKPTTESAGAFPELPQQFEGSVRPSARPRPPGRNSRPRLSVTTLGDYVLTPEQQLFWQSHESAVVLAQACVRRRRAMQDYPSHRRRHRIALELWTTEQTYIKSLQQCTQMRKRLESQPKPILTPLEIKYNQPNQTLFSETETILLYATELESKLRQQLEHWHVDQTLAHVFTEIQPFFKVYNRYMIQYNSSLTTYKHALQSSAFQHFLQACAEDFVHTDLPSILIMPVQRIPRYILLLDALVSHTPTTHTDYADLCTALDIMKRFTESANQTQRNYERYQAILRLHELLQPQIPNLVVPSRVFQGAGSLLLIDGSRVMRRNQRKVRQIFLFNDLLLVTKHIRSEHKYHLKVLVFLSSVQLDHNPPVPGEDGERCFLLRSRQRPAQSLLLEARSTEDKMAWVIALERATYLLAQPRTCPSPP